MQLLHEEPTVPAGTITATNGQAGDGQQAKTTTHGEYDGGTNITIAVSNGPGTTRYLFSPERRALTRRMSPGNLHRPNA